MTPFCNAQSDTQHNPIIPSSSPKTWTCPSVRCTACSIANGGRTSIRGRHVTHDKSSEEVLRLNDLEP
eukprot:6123304-Ditylum_brightwellii.AAC.1